MQAETSFMLPLKSGSDPPFLTSGSPLYKETWAKFPGCCSNARPRLCVDCIGSPISTASQPDSSAVVIHTVQSAVKLSHVLI